MAKALLLAVLWGAAHDIRRPCRVHVYGMRVHREPL